MKKITCILSLLVLAIGSLSAQSNDAQLEVLLNNDNVSLFPLASAPKATFSGHKMRITTGADEQQMDVKDIKSIQYTEKGANVCVFRNNYSNVAIDFDKIYANQMTFNGKSAIVIEAEDLENVIDAKSTDIEVVSPLPQYADRVSGGKLLHASAATRSANVSVTFGNLHVTGNYNIYIVSVPGTYVNEEDSLVRTQKVRLTCAYQSYNGTSYSSKQLSCGTNPDNSSEKLMIDHSIIDTLLVTRKYSCPTVTLDETHTGSFKFQSVKLSADNTVNDFYIDCIVLIPIDNEGNEISDQSTLVMQNGNVRSFIPTDNLEYISWQKEQIIVDEEIKIPYGNTTKLSYSFSPEFITYPSVKIESENPDIASVDAKGNVTGNFIGSTYIVLTDEVGGATARCKVIVTGNPASANSLIVNEVMSANLDQIVDPSFNYGGWIELYNPTDKDLVIASCYVSDEADNLTKFHLSSKAGIIPAHGFKNIWFDHSDYTRDQVPFKLDCDGGTIYFSDANGNLIVSQDYPEAIARCSYARKSDGSDEWGWTGYPTPGKTNATSVFASEQVADPEVSIQSAIYDETTEFQVTVPEGAKLFYTTNGSVPTETNGKESEDGKFSFATHAAVRFRAYKDGYLPSNVVTRSFIRADNYAKQQGVDIRNLPIISIITANANLNSDELGIFVQGKNGRPGNGHSSKYNTNMDWDRPVDFQYFKDGEYVFSQEVDIANCGGWSRTYGYHSSFKIKADKKYYGLKTLDYPFFEQKPYLKNKTLQIRNGGNDSDARIKDAALQSIIMSSDLNIDGQSYQPTLHFINGKFYGVINMREPNNKHFVYSNYGWDSDEIDMFEMGPDSAYCQKCGTKDAYLEWYELAKNAADPVTYSQICKLVDIDEYVNYVAIQLYLNNWDWPQNNLKGFRHRDGGKFRFVVYDLDNSLQRTSNPFSTFFGKKKFTFDTIYPENIKLTAEIEFVTIFENMLQNDEFRKKFIDSFCLVGGCVFEPNHVYQIADELLERVGEIQYSLEGWEKSPYNTVYNLQYMLQSDDYNSSMKMAHDMKNSPKFKLTGTQMQNCWITSFADGDNSMFVPSVLYNRMKMPTETFDGALFSPVILTAEAVPGFKFEGWLDAESFDVLCADAEYTLPSDKDMQIVALYSSLTDEEKQSQGVTPVRINEISAANTVYANDYNKREDWVEFYNTTYEPIDMEGMYLTDNPEKSEKYQIKSVGDESTIIPPFGYKIIWFDKKEGISQLHAPFKLDDDGDVLYLSAADHSWTDSFAYAPHDGNHTVGRYPDGCDSIFVMNTPTIGKKNITSSYVVKVIDGQLDPTIIEAVRKLKRIELAYSNETLQIESVSATDAIINIFAIDGRKQLTLNESLLEGNNSISVASLSPGTYLAFVKTHDGKHASIKFVR